ISRATATTTAVVPTSPPVRAKCLRCMPYLTFLSKSLALNQKDQDSICVAQLEVSRKVALLQSVIPPAQTRPATVPRCGRERAPPRARADNQEGRAPAAPGASSRSCE